MSIQISSVLSAAHSLSYSLFGLRELMIALSFYRTKCSLSIQRHEFIHAYPKTQLNIMSHSVCMHVCVRFAWIIEFHNVPLHCWIQKLYLFTWLNKFIIIEAIVFVLSTRRNEHFAQMNEVYSIGTGCCRMHYSLSITFNPNRRLTFNSIFNLIISTIAPIQLPVWCVSWIFVRHVNDYHPIPSLQRSLFKSKIKTMNQSYESTN